MDDTINICYFSDLSIDSWTRSNGDVVYQDSNTSDSVVIPAEALEKIATGVSLFQFFKKKYSLVTPLSFVKVSTCMCMHIPIGTSNSTLLYLIFSDMNVDKLVVAISHYKSVYSVLKSRLVIHTILK